jgi:hypothetical protein
MSAEAPLLLDAGWYARLSLLLARKEEDVADT